MDTYTQNETNEVNVIVNSDDDYQFISDDLISNAIGTSELAVKNLRALLNVPRELFSNENYVLYVLLDALKSKGENGDPLPLTEKHIERNLRGLPVLQEAKRKGRLNNIAMIGDDVDVVAYTAEVIKQFRNLQIEEDQRKDNASYLLLIEDFYVVTGIQKAHAILNQGKQIIQNTDDLNSKTAGLLDASAYVRRELTALEDMVSADSGAGFIAAEDIDLEKGKNKPVLLSHFDGLGVLNNPEYIGGIYSGMFYNILAPTKGGKSKFCARMAHSVLVGIDSPTQQGHDVVIWPYEGGADAFLAQLIVIHTEWMNRDKPFHSSINGTVLNQRSVLFDTYAGDPATQTKIRSLVQTAKTDLLTNTKYGKILFIDKPLVLETFIDNMTNAIKMNNNAQFLCVDYLQLISSEDGKLNKPQMISSAYQQTLAFCKKYNCCVVSPSQMKQEAINELASRKPGEAHELRTAAGESAEVIRTPDYNIVIHSTPSDAGKGNATGRPMTLLPMQSRYSKDYPHTSLWVDLGTCLFRAVKEAEEELKPNP